MVLLVWMNWSSLSLESFFKLRITINDGESEKKSVSKGKCQEEDEAGVWGESGGGIGEREYCIK